MTYSVVECLRCGGPRRVASLTGGRADPGECPRCRYLGWAPSEALSEKARRRIREHPPEQRQRLQRVV